MLSNLFEHFNELFDKGCVSPVQPQAAQANAFLNSLQGLQRSLLFNQCQVSEHNLLTLKYLTVFLQRPVIDRLVKVVNEDGEIESCYVIADDPDDISFLTKRLRTCVSVHADQFLRLCPCVSGVASQS